MARTTLRREVIRADPEWVKDKRKELAYEFSNGRQFFVNPDKTGAYDPATWPPDEPPEE